MTTAYDMGIVFPLHETVEPGDITVTNGDVEDAVRMLFCQACTRLGLELESRISVDVHTADVQASALVTGAAGLPRHFTEDRWEDAA